MNRKWEHEGSMIKGGKKYTLVNSVLYKWLNEEMEGFESELCPRCGTNTECVKLASCEHSIVMCKCTPYNYFALRDNQPPNTCIHCNKWIFLPENIEKAARQYKLKEL